MITNAAAARPQLADPSMVHTGKVTLHFKLQFS